MMNELDEKLKRDNARYVSIKNAMLICKNCKKRFDDEVESGNTSRCEVYDSKPFSVYKTKSVCEMYEEE